jgi:hypothetical protein
MADDHYAEAWEAAARHPACPSGSAAIGATRASTGQLAPLRRLPRPVPGAVSATSAYRADSRATAAHRGQGQHDKRGDRPRSRRCRASRTSPSSARRASRNDGEAGPAQRPAEMGVAVTGALRLRRAARWFFVPDIFRPELDQRMSSKRGRRHVGPAPASSTAAQGAAASGMACAEGL